MGGFEDDSIPDSNVDDGKRAERKFKKHMVEKRRRNRINYALDQLKMMVLEGLDKDPTKYDKMEKADILDLTVKYLHRILKENIHFGPEMMQGLPPMFGEHFAGSFFGHQLPPHPSILPEQPCTSASLLEEPLDLHNRTMTSQSSVISNVTSRSRAESPCIDIDSDSENSDSDDMDNVGFKPVKKHSPTERSKTVKRSFRVDKDDVPSKKSRSETSESTSSPPSYSSIKLNITGQAVSSLNSISNLSKPGPSIVRPVATVPRLSLQTDNNIKTHFPTLPFPSHPYPGMGAPLLPLPIMHSDLQWRPW